MDTRQFRPHVMIVGAGLGGLTLAAILEHTNISYTIFEKVAQVKPLGSAVALGANVMYMLEQLDLLEGLHAVSKFNSSAVRTYKEVSNGFQLQMLFDYQTEIKEMFGYNGVIVSRPALYDLLLSKIPPKKMLFGKRILSHAQSDNGVMVRCADNTTYSGDILVGADGAYSGIRQGLYKQLDDAGMLPKPDKEPMQLTSVSIVGQTSPLDPAKFPEVEDEFCRFDTILGSNKRYLWAIFTTIDRRICWMVVERLTSESRKVNDTFRNTEWSTEAAEAMCNIVRGFPITFGKDLTLGDLIDATPKDLISKMMLDEKMYETWFGGRIALIGDGAVSAMQDACVFANYLNTLETNNINEITKVFQSYRDERYPVTRGAVETSMQLSKISTVSVIPASAARQTVRFQQLTIHSLHRYRVFLAAYSARP
ncbi:hypothetical protein BG011_007291 [Mortierella polycephala]|uniref:FAD-binding domain-containing protein n=1 Tax=Mortierella polycephala TaxID=41804 RepID=A0A9P6PQL3_9FUNG|nr:hypothetical protein BG011_007291 [Mortierella polycephala]